MTRPILVVSLPRSGSSMVAGILAAHGIWAGTCREADEHNPRGYFEHAALNQLIAEEIGPLVNRGEIRAPPPGFIDRVHETIRADGYEGGPWLYKCSVVYWRLFEPLNPIWVTVRRGVRSVLASGRASERYRPNPGSVGRHLWALVYLEAERGAHVIRAQDIVGGDYSALEPVLEAVGLRLDPAVVREFVDPKLWKHGP